MTTSISTRRATRAAFGVLAALTINLVVNGIADAREFDQLDVEYAVHQSALRSGIDAENAMLTIARMHIPQSEQDMGFACGSIEYLPGVEGGMHFNSFMAPLDIQDGQLHAQMLLAVFMPVEQILEESYCKR